MVSIVRFIAIALFALAFAPRGLADGRKPGSVLVYTVHRSAPGYFTIISVTNTDTTVASPTTLGGGTNVRFDYINVTPDPTNPMFPLASDLFSRMEYLSPADTLSVMTSCHDASYGTTQGYLVVSAEDPSVFQSRWSHNYLIGSEVIITPCGAVYVVDAIPFSSPVEAQRPTDVNGNMLIDFDGSEYEAIPDILYIENFIADTDTTLTLINLGGGAAFTATIKVEAWNNNEFPLSGTRSFRCWAQPTLVELSPLFDPWFLHNNTPSDPTELDVTCDGVGEFETGWARIYGLVAQSPQKTVNKPAILASFGSWPFSTKTLGGHLLWESTTKVTNGQFLYFGIGDSSDPK